MKQGKVQWVIVGADRIAANGAANKIGTYSAAIVARHHGVRFMVVAPTSTVDMATRDAAGELVDAWDTSGIRHGSLSSPAYRDYLFGSCRQQIDAAWITCSWTNTPRR